MTVTRFERGQELRAMSLKDLAKLVPERTHVQFMNQAFALSYEELREKMREAVIEILLIMEYPTPDQKQKGKGPTRDERWEQLYRTPVAELLELARKLGITDVVIPRRMTLDEFETGSGSTSEEDKRLVEAIMDAEERSNN